MARRFVVDIDLQGNELQNAVIQNLTSDPTGIEGKIQWRSDTNELKIYDGGAWVVIPSGLITSAMIVDGAIVNADVNAAAAIARSKLDFGTGLVNADIAAAAGIVYSKLNLATSIVNADIGAAAGIVYTKLNLTTSIVNTDINAAAAIARSKLDFGSGLVNADIAVAAAIAKTKLANLDVVNADVNAAAAIAESKLSLATDAAVGTGSRRTLGLGALQAMPGNTALNAITVPAAAVAMNAQKITGMADPTTAQDAATKAYVDATAVGLDVKPSVRAASTANVTLPPGGTTLTIDGVVLANTDRVLLKDQTTGSQNGIYVVSGIGTSVVLTRGTDSDTSAEVTAGLFTFVSEGTVAADSGWYLTTNNPIVLNTTALAFTQFSGAGQITAGAALTKSGNTLDVAVDGASIEVNADALRVKALGITNAMLAGSIDAATKLTGLTPIANGGTAASTAAAARTNLVAPGRYDNAATHASATTIVITAATHGLGAGRNKVVQVIEEATGEVIEAGIVIAANGDVTVSFDVAPLLNTHRVCIVGW